MKNSKTQAGNLAVVKIKDFSGDERFDVFLVKPKDQEHYSLSLSSWSEYHSYEIYEKSLERYGAEIVAEAIINDMTFFGATRKQRDNRRHSIIRSLNKISSEDTGNYLSGEEFFKQFRIENELLPSEEKTEVQKMIEYNEMFSIQLESYAEMDLLGIPYKKEC